MSARFALTFAIVLAALPARADDLLYLTTSAPTIVLGEDAVIELRLDAVSGRSLLTYGADIYVTLPGVLGAVTFQRGPLWLELASVDGDGIAGASTSGLGYNGTILLGTMIYTGDTIGVARLLPSVTAGDATEGFAYGGTGAPPTVLFAGTTVRVVPEPGALLLALASFGTLAWCDAPRRRGLGAIARMAPNADA